MRCFYSFSAVLEESSDVKRVVKILRGLNKAHLRFLAFKNLKKRVHPLTTAHLTRTVQFVRLCSLQVKHYIAWKNNWKPLFALISVSSTKTIRLFALDFYDSDS